MTMQSSTAPAAGEPWWRGVTRYQWLVLAIASAGWVFDVFEGQIFGSCMNEALPDLLQRRGLGDRQELFVNVGLAAFLAGVALGGVLFGIMADRWGRRRTMAITILMYSSFTGHWSGPLFQHGPRRFRSGLAGIWFFAGRPLAFEPAASDAAAW